jgi:uncharacterized membrane protein
VSVISESLDSTSALVDQPARPTVANALAWALLIVGAVLRIARWTHWRSLWLDEIYLANNIVSRSLHGLLFSPLDDWQAAPPGFLLLMHFAVRLLGTGERALRLVSLLFGLASLPLALAVSRRTLSPRAVVLAVAFFVFLGPLIYYSNEAKPYSCDVAFSLAITLAVLRLMDRPSVGRAVCAALVGAMGIFCSYPAAFVVAGAAMFLLLRRATADARQIGIVCAIWGAALLLQYLVFLRPFTHGEAHQHLVAYWQAQDAFMPRTPATALLWLFSCLESIARAPGAMWLEYPDAAVAALLIGAAVALRRRDDLLILLAPLPFVLLASAMNKYPLGDRLALFLVPQFLMLMAAGLDALWTHFPAKIAALALAGMVLLPSANRACGFLVLPPGREETLPAYRWIARQWRSGDAIYLTTYAAPSFHYYQSQVAWPPGADPSAAAHVQPDFADAPAILDDIKPLAGRKRVWIALVHLEGSLPDIAALTLAAFDQIGHPCARHLELGVTVYLYDCSTPIR